MAKRDAVGNLKYGFIDTTGAIVLPIEYDSAFSISNVSGNPTRLCGVQKGLNWGIFENPYYTSDEPGEPDDDLFGDITDNTDRDKGKEKDTDKGTDKTNDGAISKRDDDDGGIPVMPVVLGAVTGAAVVIVVIVAVLVFKRKKKPRPRL